MCVEFNYLMVVLLVGSHYSSVSNLQTRFLWVRLATSRFAFLSANFKHGPCTFRLFTASPSHLLFIYFLLENISQDTILISELKFLSFSLWTCRNMKQWFFWVIFLEISSKIKSWKQQKKKEILTELGTRFIISYYKKFRNQYS